MRVTLTDFSAMILLRFLDKVVHSADSYLVYGVDGPYAANQIIPSNFYRRRHDRREPRRRR